MSPAHATAMSPVKVSDAGLVLVSCVRAASRVFVAAKDEFDRVVAVAKTQLLSASHDMETKTVHQGSARGDSHPLKRRLRWATEPVGAPSPRPPLPQIPHILCSVASPSVLSMSHM